MSTPAGPTRAATLRALLRQGPVVLPGALNALTARLIERQGFGAFYLSGAVIANSVLGVPDIGLTTLDEVTRHAGQCVAATTLPAIADADTGFGGPANAARTVREFERVGLAGLHLEDQEFPKRCGHLPGKRLVPVDEFREKLAAAVAARRDPDFLIIARTDARGVTGYDDAVARARAYLAAGADAIFPEALRSREEFARFARDVPALLLANLTEFGQSPNLTADELGELGYRLIIFPVTLQRLAMGALRAALAELRATGTSRGLLERMQTRAELYDLLGYDEPAPPRPAEEQA